MVCVWNLGDERAQFNIAVMYYRGEYIEKSYPNALAWALIARDSGSESATSLITIIEKKLTSSELEEVKKIQQRLVLDYGKSVVDEKILLQLSDKNASSKASKPLYNVNPKYPIGMAQKGRYGVAKFCAVVSGGGKRRIAIG